MVDDQTRVWVGAFGKHPGWDDHLSDQGLETELLVRIKRLLYLEGIGGNLDAGAWDALDADERRNGFDHVFLWRWPEGLVVGRMWSSSDGKGRTRYPMIVCAQTRGLSSSWVVGDCLARLEKLGTECRATSDAGGVIMAVDRARQEMRGLGSGAPQARSDGIAGTPAIVALAECGAIGESAEGLVRIAYQLEREFSSFLRNEEDSGQKSRTVDVRPRHMRVPACTKDAGAGCEQWIRYLLDRVDASTPILAIAPTDGSCIDLVVGLPTSGQFLCLQATNKRIPLSTDIPYTIDDEFRQSALGRIEQAKQGAKRDRDPGLTTEVASVSRRAVGHGIKKSGKKPSKGLMVGAAVLLLAVLVFAVVKLMSAGGTTPAPRPTVDEGTPPAGDVVATDAQIAEFRAWCLAYHGWLRGLADEVQRRGEGARLDSFFAERVVGPVAEALAQRTTINPRDVVSNPPPTVLILSENIPGEIARPEILSKTQRATQLIGDVDSGLRAWPVRIETEAMVSRFEALGWKGPAEELKELLKGALPGGSQNMLDAAASLRRAWESASPLGTLIADLGRGAKHMRSSGDSVLAAEADAIDQKLAEFSSAEHVRDLLSLAAPLEELAELTRRVEETLETKWDNVDRDSFFSASRVHTDPNTQSGAGRLRLWLAEVGQDVYQSLRVEDDPRGQLSVGHDLERVQTELAELQRKGGSDAEEGVGALRDRASALTSQLEALRSLRWNRLTRQEVEQTSESLERDMRSLARDISALRGSIETDATEYVLSQRSMSSISTDGLTSIDAAWVSGRDALLARFESDGSLMGLRRDLDRLSDALRMVEESSRIDLGFESMPSDWEVGALRLAQRAKRNQAIADVVAPWRQGEVNGEAVAAERVAQIVSGWSDSMRVRLAVLHDVERRVRGMYAIDEPGVDGQTLEKVLDESFGGVGAGDDWAVWEALAPLLWRKIEGLHAVQQARGERAALAALATDAGVEDGARLDAWRSLMQEAHAWPTAIHEIESAIELRSRLVTAASRVDDPDRAKAIRSEVERDLARAWGRAATEAGDWNTLNSVLRLRERCVGVLESLPQKTRVRVLALQMRAGVQADAADEFNREKIREMVRSLSLTQVREGWLAEVMAVVDEPDDGLPPLDPSAVGPARAGWAAVDSGNEHTLVYSSGSGSGAIRLEFRLVTDAAGRTSFVATHELSVGAVASLVSADAEARAALIESLGGASERQESRAGMLTWQWRASRDGVVLGAAESWIAATYEPQDYYARPQRGAGPGRLHPFHRLGLSDALYIAGRLGCRLPTIEEWNAAASEVSDIALSGGWNLRDARVVEQVEHVRGRLATPGWRGRLPDEGAFEGWRGDESHSFSDDHLWVSTVDSGPESAFRHLLGNVGEYVIVRAPDEELYRTFGNDPGQVNMDVASRMAREVSAGVIGGSLFSRVDMSVFDPIEVRDVPRGWSDVGLRLAFTGHARLSVASRVHALLELAEY